MFFQNKKGDLVSFHQYVSPFIPILFFKKPRLHGIKNLYQFLFFNNVGNHRIHILQERPAEDAPLIGKLLKSFQCIRIINFNAGTAAHNAHFSDKRIHT